MNTYTYSQARQNLSSLLDKARQEGGIIIKRKDGSYFVVKPMTIDKSPLDVPGIDLGISRDEILSTLREIRER